MSTATVQFFSIARSHLTRLSRATGGSILLEAAFIVSLLLTLLIGIFWIGRGYNTYQTITRAAREGARFAVAPSCATCGNAYPSDAEVQAVINASLAASSLDPGEVTPNPVPVQRGVVLNPGSNPQETGVVIAFTYPFEIFLPFTSVGLSTLTLATQVQMREEK
jgi:Flp pilus assembly protein TadG